MIDPEFMGKFDEYLDWDAPNADKKNAWELGLVQDAPPEAVEAYTEYQKKMREAAEKGIEL